MAEVEDDFQENELDDLNDLSGSGLSSSSSDGMSVDEKDADEPAALEELKPMDVLSITRLLNSSRVKEHLKVSLSDIPFISYRSSES